MSVCLYGWMGRWVGGWMVGGIDRPMDSWEYPLCKSECRVRIICSSTERAFLGRGSPLGEIFK